MKKMDHQPPRKRRRLVPRVGTTVLSSGVSAAVIQLPSLVGGSVAVDGLTLANAIPIGDSSDDDNGGSSIRMVNNKEIVSFYLLLFSCMYMDV